IRRCFLSALDYRVAVYMRANDFDATDPKIAVVVQKQIASDISGVGFSLNPVTNNYDDAVFNANWGLGETVVAGLVTPDTFTVDKVREEVKEAVIGSKELSIWADPKRRYRGEETVPEQRPDPLEHPADRTHPARRKCREDIWHAHGYRMGVRT